LALQEPLARLLPGANRIQVDGTGALQGALVFLLNYDLPNDQVGRGVIIQADDTGAYHGQVAVDVSCTVPQNHIELWQTDMDGIASARKTYRLPNSLADVMLPPGDAGCPDAGTFGGDAAADVGAD
jgi:hypothetical protein